MNSILKKILLVAKDVAEQTATQTIPGAGPMISGLEKLLDKDKANNVQGILEFESGFLLALNNLKHEQVADAAKLNLGILQAKTAFDTIKDALTPDTEV